MGYFHVTIKGTKGILNCSSVNRDAIGAFLVVTLDENDNDNPQLQVTVPIKGGSSHLSQHSLQKIFGMGSKPTNAASLLIKYPYKNGGYITNQLNDIKASEKLTLYEIPCDYQSRNQDLTQYTECVEYALCTLNTSGLITDELSNRLY